MSNGSALPLRGVDYLRLSITDRCNYRCTYCMPPEGVPPLRHEDILSYEQYAAVARVAVGIGIDKVRITGGEPLVRRGCVDFVQMLAGIEGLVDLSLTTNAALLPRFAADLRRAGLRRVNVSIDSLQAARYAAITRGGRLQDALAGIDAAFAAGFDPIKVNVVLLTGIEDELDDWVRLIRDLDVHVRFIEYMPLDRRHGVTETFLPAATVLEALRARYDLAPVDGPYGHGPARYWKVGGARGTIGFIAGVSDHFCGTCNRLRLTADGRLKTCLFSGNEVDLRPYLDEPRELRDAMLAALRSKSFDKHAEGVANCRAMSQIGG